MCGRCCNAPLSHWPHPRAAAAAAGSRQSSGCWTQPSSEQVACCPAAAAAHLHLHGRGLDVAVAAAVPPCEALVGSCMRVHMRARMCRRVGGSSCCTSQGTIPCRHVRAGCPPFHTPYCTPCTSHHHECPYSRGWPQVVGTGAHTCGGICQVQQALGQQAPGEEGEDGHDACVGAENILELLASSERASPLLRSIGCSTRQLTSKADGHPQVHRVRAVRAVPFSPPRHAPVAPA